MLDNDTDQTQTRAESGSDASTLQNPSDSNSSGSTAAGGPTMLATGPFVERGGSNQTPMSKAAISRRRSSRCMKLNPSDVYVGRSLYPVEVRSANRDQESPNQQSENPNQTYEGEGRKSFTLGRRPVFASFDRPRARGSSSMDVSRFNGESPSEANAHRSGWFNGAPQPVIPPVPPIPDFISRKFAPKQVLTKILSQQRIDESESHLQKLETSSAARRATSLDANRSSLHSHSNSSFTLPDMKTTLELRHISSLHSDTSYMPSDTSLVRSSNNNFPIQNQRERPPSTPMRSVPADYSSRQSFGIGRKMSLRNLHSNLMASSTRAAAPLFKSQTSQSKTSQAFEAKNGRDHATAKFGKKWLSLLARRRSAAKDSKDSYDAFPKKAQTYATRQLNASENVGSKKGEWMGIVRRNTSKLFRKNAAE
ncbi:hypothetical protein BJ741DRAFT_92346 [Chytriomyces cf. hyalinus JEL632]|nr:hypothetical protein BJ741DRAFT_92346 [Chytriomyces cf. hyalinus JEL632]